MCNTVTLSLRAVRIQSSARSEDQELTLWQLPWRWLVAEEGDKCILKVKVKMVRCKVMRGDVR